MTSFHANFPRSGLLLIGLLILIVAAPSASGTSAHFIFELMFDLILLSGVYAAGLKRNRVGFGAITALTFTVRWIELIFEPVGFEPLALGLTAFWLVWAMTILIVELFRRQDVTLDTIISSVVVYLLAAVAFMMIFALIELNEPGSFSGVAEDTAGDAKLLRGTMLYFSLVSLTTVGYGDIVPVSNVARPLAVLEGVFGQLYLAIMIARLVGLHISRTRTD